jgi:hypothetical protein
MQSHLKKLEEQNNNESFNNTKSLEADNVQNVDEDEEEDDDDDMFTIVLNLLAAILSLGSKDRSVDEEYMLRYLVMEKLIRISKLEKNIEVIQNVTDVVLLIMTRGSSGSSTTTKSADATKHIVEVKEKKVSEKVHSVCDEAMNNFCDESPAMRAMGVSKISHLLRDKEIISKVCLVLYHILFILTLLMLIVIM